MDRRRFLRMASALAAGGTTTALGMRRASAEGGPQGFLPQVGADAGAAPVHVVPNTVVPVIDAGVEDAFGKFTFRDRYWSLNQGILEDDGWRTVRVDGVATSNMRYANALFMGQFVGDSGEVTSTHLVPMTWGSRSVISPPGGTNQFHFNTVYDLPGEATGQRFRGTMFMGAEVPGPRVVIERESDYWRLAANTFDDTQFALAGELIQAESYFDTGPAYSHRFSFGNADAGSPLVVRVDEAGDTWVGNALIIDNSADLIYDFREVPSLAGPRAVIDDFVVGASQNRLFFHVETPIAATDFVPVLSWPGLPPTTGQTIRTTIWPGEVTPFIFNLPKQQTDSLRAADFSLDISGYEELVDAAFRASLRPRKSALFQGAAGLEVLSVIQNPFPTALDLTGMSADTWVVRNDDAGEFEAAEGLFSHPLGTGTLPGGGRRRYRQPASDWSDLHPSAYWPHDVQDAWNQARSDPSSLTEEQRAALMRFGLPTSIRRP